METNGVVGQHEYKEELPAAMEGDTKVPEEVNTSRGLVPQRREPFMVAVKRGTVNLIATVINMQALLRQLESRWQLGLARARTQIHGYLIADQACIYLRT